MELSAEGCESDVPNRLRRAGFSRSPYRRKHPSDSLFVSAKDLAEDVHRDYFLVASELLPDE